MSGPKRSTTCACSSRIFRMMAGWRCSSGSSEPIVAPVVSCPAARRGANKGHYYLSSFFLHVTAGKA